MVTAFTRLFISVLGFSLKLGETECRQQITYLREKGLASPNVASSAILPFYGFRLITQGRGLIQRRLNHNRILYLLPVGVAKTPVARGSFLFCLQGPYLTAVLSQKTSFP